MDRCSQQPAPLFTFGVIADVQYADMDDGFNFSRTKKRYYRSSLKLLRNALDSWSDSAVKPAFVLQLGDVIDGFNKPSGASQRALDTVMRDFASCPVPVHHVWGNHELYNFSRTQLTGSPLDSSPYADRRPQQGDIYAYRFSPFPGFVFVVLDAYDVSLLGVPEASERYSKAVNLIKLHNNNEDLNCPPESPCHSRFTMFNGGFSQEQLDWLDSVLSEADERQEKVTLVSHIPVHPGSTDYVCLAWNHEELLAITRSHGCVVCYMAGHAHSGGYCLDTGVHHLTLDGVIETPPDSDAYAMVSVYPDRMELTGSGTVMDRVFLFS
ncbi:manganese-dependent ADP-ribose/CDP-alcohol diphosphatase [Poeciliopsis prolifica]|uniref:manganese-dependent ADP-ribose/CDP-alcohol diphosphatase n=1 Tax=Poeciliopsis prolifica TaxID=188132 RepID=UPI0024143532|nr:manganese-dependent ADP-ribose/CDP-alcohol diphosphatase [Poeciliopsis prolifica]